MLNHTGEVNQLIGTKCSVWLLSEGASTNWTDKFFILTMVFVLLNGREGGDLFRCYSFDLSKKLFVFDTFMDFKKKISYYLRVFLPCKRFFHLGKRFLMLGFRVMFISFSYVIFVKTVVIFAFLVKNSLV